eukprot:jgi/Hompol1/5398/HPOL_004404-RA
MRPSFRRAERSDAKNIKKLIKGSFGKDDMDRTLQRRYGSDYDIANLIETSPISIVATDEQDTVVLGFVAFSLSPPLNVVSKILGGDTSEAQKILTGAWDMWLQTLYDTHIIRIHNTAFLTFLCAEPEISVQFLDTVLTTVFEIFPNLKSIVYFMPDSLILFPPFSSQRYQPPLVDVHDTTAAVAAAPAESLAHVGRKRFRNLRKNTKYFTEIALHPTTSEHADYFLAGLVEGQSDLVRTLVAEADGEVVGFMSINRDIDQTKLHSVYRLEMLDYLMRDVKPFPDKITRAKTPILKMHVTEGETQVETDAEEITIQVPQIATSIPTLSIDVTPSFESELEHVDAIDQKDLATQNTFCINMFCIENNYVAHAAEFVRIAFEMFPGRDFCAVSVPANTPHVRLLEMFSYVDVCEGMIAPHNLFITNRFGMGNLVNVRLANQEDLDKIDLLTFGIKNQDDIVQEARSSIRKERAAQVVAAIVLKVVADPTPYLDQIEYPNRLRDGVLLPDALPFNMQMTTTTLLMEPRIVVNARIVVVGGSDVGIAFLEHLVYTSHLHFTHLTLISMDGDPSLDNQDYFVSHLCYTALEIKQIALHRHVKVIRGSASQLDREGKLVKLVDGRIVPYDYLILTPGLQYHVGKLHKDLEGLRGVYSFNQHEQESLLRGVETFKAGNPETVIVVKPTAFENHSIEKRIFDHLDRIGVKLYRGYRILKWGLDTNVIPNAFFGVVLVDRETGKPLRIAFANTLIYADEKSVDPTTFKLINDSCLVFDGRLVIDQYFRTDDPFIFGAGSITKYVSRYQTKWMHAYYDSKQVGIKLAETLMPMFDPTVSSTVLEETNEIVPLKQHKKIQALLPGGMRYVFFDKPRLNGQRAVEEQDKNTYGRDLILDKPAEGSYFQLHLTPHGYIQSMTYLGHEAIPVDNLMCLYGMHERYFNRMVARFDEGIIHDFVK